MFSNHPITTAILSYGMSGEVFHAPLVSAHKGFLLKTILERSSQKSLQYYPSVKIARSFDEVLSDHEIELVVVNTPHSTHHEFALKALAANKHVVVEKPFTITSKEAKELISFAKEKNKILSVFQSRRWDGGFITMKKILDDGLLGKVVEYEAHYDRFRNYVTPDTWKEEATPGSGILFNLGSHMLDQVLVLFGKPDSVSAKMGVQRPGGKIDDFYDIRLAYKDLNVIVKSSYIVREPGPLYSIHGIKGSFVKFGIDPQEEALKLHHIPGAPGWGNEPEKYWGKLNTEINGIHFEGRIETIPGSYLGYYQNVYEAIREQKDVLVKGEDGLNVILLIEAAIKSHLEKREVSY